MEMIEYYNKHSLHEPFQQIRHRTEGCWVHVSEPDQTTISELADEYDLDKNILRDVLDTNELPRREHSKGTLYVFVRSARRTKSGDILTSPLLIITNKNVFMTIAATGAITSAEIAEASKDHAIRTAHSTAMLILVMQATVRQYETLIQHTDNYIQDIRHKLKTHEVNNDDFVHFVTVEDNLNEYQANLKDTQDLTCRLRENNHSLFSEHEVELLQDIELYSKELLSLVVSLNSTVASIRNAYSTIANNTLNQRMKVLTVLTVLIALPNVLFGMYGMNVPLPFQDAPWAYALLMSVTVVVLVSVYAIAKRFRIF